MIDNYSLLKFSLKNATTYRREIDQEKTKEENDGILNSVSAAVFGDDVRYKIIAETHLELQKMNDKYLEIDDSFTYLSPAQCIKVKFFDNLFFERDSKIDEELWEAYASILGYTSAIKMLEKEFKNSYISERIIYFTLNCFLKFLKK